MSGGNGKADFDAVNAKIEEAHANTEDAAADAAAALAVVNGNRRRKTWPLLVAYKTGFLASRLWDAHAADRVAAGTAGWMQKAKAEARRAELAEAEVARLRAAIAAAKEELADIAVDDYGDPAAAADAAAAAMRHLP
jgi:hypothetical protein